MNLAVMIMAAGQSKRFDGCKLLAEIETGKSVLSNAIFQAQLSLVGDVYVITGRWHSDIKKAAEDGRIPKTSLLYCSEWNKGIGHAISYGTRHLASDYDAILITLGDQIALTSEDYSLMKSKLAASERGGRAIVCAKYAGQRGVPAVFTHHHFSKLMSLSGDTGAKKLLYGDDEIKELDLSNAIVDIDTQKDLQNWRDQDY